MVVKMASSRVPFFVLSCVSRSQWMISLPKSILNPAPISLAVRVSCLALAVALVGCSGDARQPVVPESAPPSPAKQTANSETQPDSIPSAKKQERPALPIREDAARAENSDSTEELFAALLKSDPATDISPELLNENPGYVGQQACAECHKARHAEFQETRHAKACWNAELGPMPPGFAGIPLTFPGRTDGSEFRMSRTSEGYQFTTIRHETRQDRRLASPIGFIFGSGGVADEVYFTWRGNFIHELPVSWLGPKKSWGLQDFADPNDKEDFSRLGSARCFECHTTWFQHVKGSFNEFRPESFLTGVSCERCHGPGREHVDFHLANRQVKQGHSIVVPSKLPRDRQIDVCAQCHSNAIMHRTPLFAFKPGDNLEDHFRQLKATGYENDHAADQTKYMKQSRCFQESESLTCTTCHNPHHNTSPEISGEQSCAKCHARTDCHAQESLPTEVRGECVKCHMPRYNRIAVKFHTADEPYVFPVRPVQHRIGIYPNATQEVLRNHYLRQSDQESKDRASQIENDLIQSWLKESEALAEDQRILAALGAAREAERIQPTPAVQSRVADLVQHQQRMEKARFDANKLVLRREFEAAKQALTAIIEEEPRNSFAQGRLGTLLAATGEMKEAIQHLKLVEKYNPDDPSGENMLGTLASLQKDDAEAAEHFRHADEIYPSSDDIQHRWGMALLKQNKWAEAAEHLQQAFEISPRHAGTALAISLCREKLGDASGAVQFARLAARQGELKDLESLTRLADAYEFQGAQDKGLIVLQHALHLADAQGTKEFENLSERVKRLRDSAKKP